MAFFGEGTTSGSGGVKGARSGSGVAGVRRCVYGIRSRELYFVVRKYQHSAHTFKKHAYIF